METESSEALHCSSLNTNSQMEPDALHSIFPNYDNDKKNLELLLQTFGSVVSLEDIASAYCKSGRNLYDAGNILRRLPRSTSKSSTLSTEEDLESTITSSVCSSDNSLEMTELAKPKQRKSPASLGTVSGVIGKDYVKPKVPTNGSFKEKPLKLNSAEFPVSEIWEEKDYPNRTASSDTMHQDIEEFLFKMLGEGFSMDKSVIRDIVGQCGYDVTKSMDKLLDLSASKLEKSDDILEVPSEKAINKNPTMELLQYDETPLSYTSSGSLKHNLKSGSIMQLPDINKKYDLQKEVLHALFTVSERFEEEPNICCPTRNVQRSSVYGQVVEKPLKETMIEYRSVIRRKQVNENDNEELEDSYDGLRKAVMEYWSTMKEYYKAAIDAFAKQDHGRAYKLIEEGHFFMKKAREADEKSAEKLIASNDEEEMFDVDLHDFEPKEAVRFLKVQLTSLSGIPSFKYLKVCVGSDDENAKDGPRKRLIRKFLVKEDIKWTEEGNGCIYVIPLDVIDPKKLSFANK